MILTELEPIFRRVLRSPRPLNRFLDPVFGRQVQEHYKRKGAGPGQKSLFGEPPTSGRQATLWDEELHPREEDGKFAEKEGAKQKAGIAEQGLPNLAANKTIPGIAKRKRKTTAEEFGKFKDAMTAAKGDGTIQPDEPKTVRRQESPDEVLNEAKHQLEVETPKPANDPPEIAFDAQGQAHADSIRNKMVADFGEKIGGARKDIARPLGPRKKDDKPKDERPAWARRYDVHLIEKSNNKFEEGKYGVYDTKQKGFYGQEKRLGVYDTREGAEKSVPQAEVSRGHGVTAIAKADGTKDYIIYRKVSDRKRPTVKGGFASYEAARQYMAEHPEEIIEHKFPRYEDYKYLDHVERQGGKPRSGDVKTADFQKDFGFRGGEFGNWQTNKDGQTSLNHAYDALHDLSEILGVPPKALSLDGRLAIAFGARGTGGKNAAFAHYEPDLQVINLTKMKGAGSLAHEWVHGMDDYFGRQASGTPDQSQHASDKRYAPKELRPEIHDAGNHLVDTIAAKDVTAAIAEAPAQKQLSSLREHVKERLDDLERGLQPGSYRKVKPFTPAQQKEWDEAKEKLSRGDPGKSHWVTAKQSRGRMSTAGHHSYEALEKLNALYKAATGRSFHTSDSGSAGHRLYWSISSAIDAEKRVKDAAAGKTSTSKQATDFLREARRLDETQGGDYYTLRHEMVARSFESYVYDKLKEAKRRNDYLVGKAENHFYKMFDMAPFPEGEERIAINAAFDKLFKAIRHEPREDEKGKHVRMYSRRLAGQMIERYARRRIVGQMVERYSRDLSRQLIERYGRGKPAAGQAALFANPAAPGKAWREELHPRDHGRFADKSAIAGAEPAPGQMDLFGGETTPAATKPIAETAAQLPPAKQRQETLFHGLNDAPGQRDLFALDKGFAHTLAEQIQAKLAAKKD